MIRNKKVQFKKNTKEDWKYSYYGHKIFGKFHIYLCIRNYFFPDLFIYLFYLFIFFFFAQKLRVHMQELYN